MGNAQVSRVDEPRVLLTEYTDLAYQDVLGSYKLFKVMKGVHEREGLVLVKLFIQRDGAPDLKEIKHKVIQVRDAFRSHWLHPNVVPYQGMDIATQSAILLRQHFARDLYDRMHTRPFLSDVARNWIAFQVLCSVCQAHSVGAVHGDLKTENIFVSSWNHAVLSDFALFKPLRLPEDDPSEFSFFFESNLNRRRCYLAPERFDANPGRSSRSIMCEPFSRELAAMDIFSLGCVLAELFLDGQTLMDLPQLLLYRSNQLNLSAKLSTIRHPAVRELLDSMLCREPAMRRTAVYYLREWCKRVLPRSFCGCLFPLSIILLNPIYQQPDMRIALIRHNFANMLWSMVGPLRIHRVLQMPEDIVSIGPGGDTAQAWKTVWREWSTHVKNTVRSIDEAMLQGMVQAASQTAALWTELPTGDQSGLHPSNSEQSVVPGGSSTSAASRHEQARNSMREEPMETSNIETGILQAGESEHGLAFSFDLAPRLTHPWLKEFRCGTFTKDLFDKWEEGCRSCIDSGGRIGSGDLAASQIYASFLADLCSRAGSGASDMEPELPGPGATEENGACEDVPSILCGIICSSLQHCANPRMKVICLDMLEQLTRFTSPSTILEQIVPYSHLLMTDPIAAVRARAIGLVTCSLACVDELPSSETHLFAEYIFPQFMSCMSGMNSEPVVLLAVATNIGTLMQHAMRFAELSVAAAQNTAGQTAQAQERLGNGNTPDQSQKRRVEADNFDVQCRHVKEAVKKIVKVLLESLPAGPQQADRMGANVHGETQMQEESLLNLAAGRDVKMALLRNTSILADSLGRDDTHNFLLPYLISFMNDPAWEVRAAFCEEAAFLPRKVGQVSTEGIIWPCYEQALLDQEQRVLRAALRGLVTLVSQCVLRRQGLAMVAAKVAPLLVHPSATIRTSAASVFSALSEHLSAVDQLAFVMPNVQRFLKVPVLGLETINGDLIKCPVGRRTFKRTLLRREEELHEALLNQKPLPQGNGQEEMKWAETDIVALDLIRPYMHMLLQARPSLVQLTGMGSVVGEERGAVMAPGALVQTLHHTTVNPHCGPSRCLQALTEFEDSTHWQQAPLSHAADHPLGLFSVQAFLTHALCLPPNPTNLGSLSYLDGTPYSIYATSMPSVEHTDACVDMRSQPQLDVAASQDSAAIQGREAELCDSVQPPADAVAGGSTASSERPSPYVDSRRRHPRSVDDAFGIFEHDTDRTHLHSNHTPWRPQGILLATLYEYAHQSGVPVVKVDATDDSRLLVTGGKDGVVKIWNCAHLERDAAVSSSHTLCVPCGDSTRRQQRLRALRTVRNAKAVAVGTESGDVLLYRLTPSRSNTSVAQVCHFAAGERSASAVMCIEQFDTELESLVVFAQQNGALQGWDVRSRAACWSIPGVPPWLGVPSSMALAGDSRAMIVGTWGGGLLLHDLRFLAPWKQWRVSSGAAVLSLRSANFGPSPGVFAALGSDSNEVALFDVTRGSCLTLFLTEPVSDRQKDAAVNVPTLLEAQTSGSDAVAPEQLQNNVVGARRGAGCVRCLWLPPRGGQTFLLAGGTDRKVRHWSLDPEHHIADSYVVTPQDTSSTSDRSRERPTYSSNHLGDVFVVQEQSRAPVAPVASKATGLNSTEFDHGRGRGTNPNHRDAILDMCSISLQQEILVTAGRDGLVKLWK